MSHGVRTALAHGVIALSATTTVWAAGAEFASASCEMPSGVTHPLIDRNGGLSQYAQLPEDCLKAMYLYCSAASEKAVLDQGPAMACSVGHEALLKRVFGGDFNKLLAWWRNNREFTPRD